MNLIILTSIIVILGILLWTFLGNTQPAVQSGSGSAGSGSPNVKTRKSDRDETTDEILEQKQKETVNRNRAEDNPALNRRRSDFIKPDEDFNLPHQTDSIIPEDSPFNIYRKTVENAQNYLHKGDYETAKTLYEGLNSRISDSSITEKIRDNLEYIDNFKQVASKKLQKRMKQEIDFPANEIKLSMSGHDSLPEHIQIGITPQRERPEFYTEEIAEKIARKIDEKQLLASAPAETVHQAAEYRQMLSKLKDEVEELNSLKKRLEDEQRGKNGGGFRELEKLNSRLDEILPYKSETDTISELRKELDILKESRSNDTEKLILQNEISRLTRENTALQNRSVSQTEVFNKSQDELKVQISNLQSGLSGLSRLGSAGSAAHQTGIPDADAISSLDSSITSLRDEIKNIGDRSVHDRGTGGVSGSQGAGPVTNSQDNRIQNTMRKELEDLEEDFEHLAHYLKGPKFNEPTDDEILGKILNDAAKEHHEKLSAGSDFGKNADGEEKEEYEIKGRKKSESGLDNFDINRLFEKNDPKDDFENQFYSKFMERHKPSGKKELPILKVTYNFEKLPDSSTLSREQNVLESSFYRYKPMIEKANQLLKRRKVKDALNYYEVVLNQDIPNQFKDMIRKNIQDLNDYLEKYMMN